MRRVQKRCETGFSFDLAWFVMLLGFLMINLSFPLLVPLIIFSFPLLVNKHEA